VIVDVTERTVPLSREVIVDVRKRTVPLSRPSPCHAPCHAQGFRHQRLRRLAQPPGGWLAGEWVDHRQEL